MTRVILHKENGVWCETFCAPGVDPHEEAPRVVPAGIDYWIVDVDELGLSKELAALPDDEAIAAMTKAYDAATASRDPDGVGEGDISLFGTVTDAQA